MTLNAFKTLCRLLGTDVKDGEEWKSLKYVHTPGEASPAADVQILLTQNRIDFSEDPPGFVIEEPPASDIMMMINDNTPVHTFIDLNHLVDVSFEVDDSIRDIYDIVTKINSCKLPISFEFKVVPNQIYFDYEGEKIPIYRFNTAKDVKVPFKVLKSGVVEKTDYDVAIKKMTTGEVVTEMSDNEKYIVTLSGKGKYVGAGSALVWVGKINP